MNGVEDLERAAVVLMAPPSAVTADDRHKAEGLFLQFRKTRNPYEMCKKILQTSQVDYVLFEAAATIKEAIIREWSLLEKREIESICSFLLCLVTERPTLQKYVCEQFLLVIAVIFKRGTLDDTEGITNLITGLQQLISRGDKTMELISCSIMKALLTEYSTTTQSTNFGRSLDFHVKCKKTFEEKDLLNIFMLTIQTLNKYIDVSIGSLSRQDVAIFMRYLSLAEQIFHWEFNHGNPLTLLRFPGCHESSQKIVFRPHKNWKDVMLNPSLLDLFFKLLRSSLIQSELSHHCMQCLTQLAPVAGAIFNNDDALLTYMSHYITCLLGVVNIHPWSAHQAFGLANVIFRLVDVSPIKVFMSIPQQLVTTLFEAMTFLSCSFMEASVKSEFEEECEEYAEASNILLDSWITVISHAEDFPAGIFNQSCLKIIMTYLKVHLSPPYGMRKPDEDEDIELDLVENDRDVYSDELSNIGQLSRLCLNEVFPIISQLIEERVGMLTKCFGSEMGNGHQDTKQLDNLFEDIHWLVLMSSYILTSDNTGESSQIPLEIVDYSNLFLTSHGQCVSSSVAYFTSLGKSDVNNVDLTIVLITTLFKVIEVEMEFLKNKKNDCFSPEVSSSLLWFLKRFTKNYLKSSNDIKLSPTLTACFDFKQDSGKFIIKTMLDIVEFNLSCWAAEPQVSEDVVKLLLGLLNDKKRADVCLQFPTVWNISKKFTMGSPDILALSPTVHRHLVHSLMRACIQISDANSQKEFQNQLVKPIMSLYQDIRSKKNFVQVAHQEPVKLGIIRTFESLRGMVPGIIGSDANILFEFLLPIFEDSVNLLQVYEHCSEMIVCILEMFVDVVEGILCMLNKENTSKFSKICLSMMEGYSKYNLGKKVIDGLAEEEKYNDILLLIQLLTHILSKDYLDLSSSSEDENVVGVCPVDVVLFGLHILIPLINPELMKYPKLSNEYFKLVTFVCEVYPEKMKTLPQELFQNFMASIQMAISNYGTDTAKCALDALSSLGKYFFTECDSNESTNNQLKCALLQFLNIVFQYMVLEQFNMDLIEPASESLFLLICCHQEDYLKLANNLIAQQHVTDENFKQRLVSAFEVLTPPGLQLTPNRLSLKQFRKNIEIFLQDVKGFLCIK